MKARRPFVRKPLENPKNAIQGLRLLRGLSAEELGRRIGVSGAQIRRAERDDTGLGNGNWNKAASELGVKPYELHDPTLPAKLSKNLPDPVLNA